MCVTSITSTTSTVPQTQTRPRPRQTRTGTRRTRTQKQHQQQLLLLLLPPPLLLLLIILTVSSLVLFLSHFEIPTTTTSTTSTTTTVNAFSISTSLYTNLRRSNNNPIIMMKATKLKEDEVAEEVEVEEVVENENETNDDPLLTPISQEWYDEISLLPNKLAYPFWYDPHPIAKKCCDQLKEELPPYYNRNQNNQNNQNNNATTNMNSITLGKMYGVLVVSLDTEKKKSSTIIQQQNQKQQLFYLKAYSGTMPRPQYGGSMITNEEMFVPLVYDRFAVVSESKSKTTTDNNDERFCYENEEDNLNYLTKEIERYQNCPNRIKEQNQLKEIEIELLKQLTDGKQQSNNNKSNRKKRRDTFRQQLIEELEQKQLNNNSSSSSSSEDNYYYNTNMNKKESHKYFLKHNNKYRILEDQLVQESAYDQRQFKTIKYDVQNKLDEIKLKIDNHEEQIQTLKKQRKQGSIDMQRKLFQEYKLLNVYGETKTPVEIFKDTILNTAPSGTGDCSAIKLFQYAFSKGYHPIALAEFWWGPSPHNINKNNNNNNSNSNSNNDSEGSEVARTHGNYYPCCRGKCEPILTRHMLLGTDVESDPLTEGIMLSKKRRRQQQEDSGKQSTSVLSIVYEDDWLVVVNKPHNVLSVPGRNIQDSIYTELKQQYPNATGPLLVHRLDYSTSGLLLATKDSNTHKHVQAQFIQRTVKKRYTALLEGDLLIQSNHTRNSINNNMMMMMKGTIDLPLAGDYLNRPMQKVDRGPEGKPAVTHYEIIDDGREKDSSPANATSVDNKKDDTDTDEKKNNKIKNTIDDDGRKRTRIHFYPVTGRTHQLRVQ
jgi:23S rRNA-/tRNA-specific pseudouridylate synthase